MKKALVIAAVFIVIGPQAASAQDAAAGEQSFRKCLACHAVGEGAKNKVGPVLNGLDGRKSGTVEGYSYSTANKDSGITWGKDFQASRWGRATNRSGMRQWGHANRTRRSRTR